MTDEDTSPTLRLAGNGEVSASNGFYELLDYEGFDDIPPDANVDNGLVSVGSTGAIILTGTMVGPVALRVEIHHAAPRLDVAGWERVVEVEQYTASGIVSVNSPLIGDPGLPSLETTGNSWYRIRIHARGIEEARAYPATVDSPVEHHLLQLWPAVPETSTEDHEFPNPALREYRVLHPG
ncbi:hypothetical protein ACWT_1076 [Actinoplanes sp. SE50]|uniref:hypothetical protein n=1 Tax=unclassified Actinoplanes TaxID=2626549 RepID=UPI00023ECC30|nr:MULTISPECIES: hypothetical protein [unclassified Actinoplanes]AEV82092.1 hypothetical protein ACPL_1195 [Actinoplanes sp. SE50/110]ATO80491.1 hypothetical protein ACWT_1076 [Actinoplanes sp. SE50]SLL97898.1 uncharacterized protein ACSP50_1111 [Actinoplanes sp. SE50/110]